MLHCFPNERKVAVDLEREELEHEVLAEYREVTRTIHSASAAVWMEIELTVPQLRTLFVLAKEGPMMIGRIAQRLGVGQPTGGHLVDRLVQAGLAERMEDAEDRRRLLAHLTTAGEELYARLLVGSQLMQGWLHLLSEEELTAYLFGLKALKRVAAAQVEAEATAQ